MKAIHLCYNWSVLRKQKGYAINIAFKTTYAFAYTRKPSITRTVKMETRNTYNKICIAIIILSCLASTFTGYMTLYWLSTDNLHMVNFNFWMTVIFFGMNISFASLIRKDPPVDDDDFFDELAKLEAAEHVAMLKLKASLENMSIKPIVQQNEQLANKSFELRSSRAGYVYLLNEINGEHWKIGKTKSPKDRLRTFNVKLPFRVEFDTLIKTDDRHSLESELHSRFASKRINGEWFALSQDDLEYIRNLAKGN